MHITNECDYAIRIVVCIAESGERIDAATISERTGVPVRFALKILRNLTAAGLIRSFKGTRGGYEMNRPPEEMSLYDIVRVVEGEYVFSRCLDAQGCNCSANNCRSATCKSKKVFEEITACVIDKLEHATISSIMSE